jgi:Xaa-Pro dipeptidase
VCGSKKVKLEEIQESLRREGLDGWLFFDHHQRDPLAYRVLGLPMETVATRRWYYFIPAEGEPRGMVHRVEPRALDGIPGEKTVYSGWREQTDGLAALLRGATKVAMQFSPRCAIPYISLVDGGTVDLIRSLGIEVESSADLIQQFEARWSEQNLACHLQAGKLVDEIRREAFVLAGQRARAGAQVTELDVKEFIRERFQKAGLVTDHGPIVAANANASNPHYEPDAEQNSAIRPGDCLLIDMWAKLDSTDGVYYDITWFGFCGNSVPERVQQVFDIVRTARDRAVDLVRTAVREGRELRGFEVDDAARNYIGEAGFGSYFVHRTGHSIGADVHGTGANMDNLETHDERRIIPWTCFSVEPGIYLPEFGIRSEVNVFVREGEAFVTGEGQNAVVRF